MINRITVNWRTDDETPGYVTSLSGDVYEAITAWAAATDSLCRAYDLNLRSLMNHGMEIVEDYQKAFCDSELYDYSTLYAMNQEET